MGRLDRASRWLLEHLPTWLLASPWQCSALAIAVLRAVLFLTGVLPATAGEQAVPKVLLYVVLGLYGLAAAFAFAQVVRGDLVTERVALMLLGPVALAYGITIIAAEPRKGIYSCALYSLVALACLIRVLVIPKLIRINAAALRPRSSR